MKNITLILICALLLGCKDSSDSNELSAKEIVSRSIKTSGVDNLSASQISFDFRAYHYMAKRQDGIFELNRTFSDGSDSISDILNNNGFTRKVNNRVIELTDSISKVYAASVNSVHYFSVLPYGLNASAVNLSRLEDEMLGDKNYYRVKVTFNADGGGEDYEDVFIYWFDKVTFKVEYLAYSYNEEDGQGLRFREAYNERYLNTIRFVDYNNFKPLIKSSTLETLGKDFIHNRLEQISTIELKNIKVKLIDN